MTNATKNIDCIDMTKHTDAKNFVDRPDKYDRALFGMCPIFQAELENFT